MKAEKVTTARRPIEEIYSQREMASVIAAERIASALRRRLAAGGEAVLVCSGGTTPGRCYDALSAAPLDWSRIRVTLSDERWVCAEDKASNERLVRHRLLRGEAREADFVPLHREGMSPEQGCEALTADADAGRLPRPFACSLLGMGEDGHFASLFPDSAALASGLDPAGDSLCLPVVTAASELPRVTLTLVPLAESEEIVLLIFGEKKWAVYERARDGDEGLPVAALLASAATPVRVVWAP
ncbi:6-phosphogluconolactonase [Lentisalinibacter sediminis]|uniref:6-phosphogluconolactonase n=1 Tax=Lentisalinibacter sediminis TaxID=2992237 RepID=UPI003870141A